MFFARCTYSNVYSTKSQIFVLRSQYKKKISNDSWKINSHYITTFINSFHIVMNGFAPIEKMNKKRNWKPIFFAAIRVGVVKGWIFLSDSGYDSICENILVLRTQRQDFIYGISSREFRIRDAVRFGRDWGMMWWKCERELWWKCLLCLLLVENC